MPPRKTIDEIAERHPKHFFGRLWHWAVKPGQAAKRRRFKALISWARDHQHLARSKDRKHKFWKARHAYHKKLRHLKKHHEQPPSSQGLTTLDGKPVPTWIAEWVVKIRAAGRWHGVVVSGYRTPEYSEQLCYGMCGAPTCPGRCAGRSSNHSQGYVFPAGAIDVTDYWTFGAECKRLGAPLQNQLPADPVHYSNSGH